MGVCMGRNATHSNHTMSYTDPFILSESSDKTVCRFATTRTIWRAEMTVEGLQYKRLEQDGKDYDIPCTAHPLSYERAMARTINQYHWTEKFWPKDLATPNYEALDRARVAQYAFTIPKTAILGIKGQEHRVVNRSGRAYTLLRIILVVIPKFGQTPVKRIVTEDKDLLCDLGRFPTWEEVRYATERVDGYGWFNAKQVIPTDRATEICIFQEIVHDLGGEPWRASRDIDNHVFGGYQRLHQVLNEYIGKDIGNSRVYY